ncbi:hypothetical protein GCM10018773_04400 [Streptomyces candidus]|nr:hypothetical protein GCM10018773_04400 [Streptomyces candidus]
MRDAREAQRTRGTCASHETQRTHAAREAPDGPGAPQSNAAREAPALPLESTGELLARITAQLSTRLGRISRNGTRTAPRPPSPA